MVHVTGSMRKPAAEVRPWTNFIFAGKAELQPWSVFLNDSRKQKLGVAISISILGLFQ